MAEKSLLKIIKFLIFVVIIGAPFFYFRYGVYPYTLAKTLFFQATVEILFFLWLALAVCFAKYRPKPTPLVVAGGVFLAAMFIVSLNGVDFSRSLWSTYERGIGLFAMFHFAALGLVVSSLYRELPWRKIFYGSLGVSVLIGAIAYAQIYVPDMLLIENPGARPGATFGNPTFMSAYLAMNVFLAIYIFFVFLREAKTFGIPWLKLSLVGAAGVFDLATIFFVQTRGDILGIAAGLVVLLFFFSFRPPEGLPPFFSRKAVYISVLAAIFLFAAVFFLTLGNPFWKDVPGLSRFQEISFSSDSPLYPRLSALQAGWKGFTEKPVLGWGPGNFAPLYDRHYDPLVLKQSYAETHIDKPHNFLLEYADGGGVILFLALIFLFAAAVYEALRQNDKLWGAVFSAALASYIVGHSFFFETIGPLMILYLFFGATNGAFRENTGQIGGFAPATGGGRISGAVVVSCLAVALVPVYAVNIKSLSASYDQYMGFRYFLDQNIIAGLRSFENAAETWSPYSWNFRRDSAVAIAGQYFNYPGTVSDEDALVAIKMMEDVRDEHPEDAFNHYALVNLYNEVAAINKKEFTEKAENEAKAALEISPDRQEIYFYLAKTKTIKGEYIEALGLLKKVLDYSPKVPDAHFYYGLLAYAVGEKAGDLRQAAILKEIGYAEIKTAMQMGRKWSTFYEPKTVAGFFADSGRLDEAIELYKTAWRMSWQSDIDTEIKLGVAYFYAKQYDEARYYLDDATKKFDVTESALYGQLEPILRELGVEIKGK